jgi:hypothetical protein
MVRFKQIGEKSAGAPIKEIAPSRTIPTHFPKEQKSKKCKIQYSRKCFSQTELPSKVSELNSLYIKEKDQTAP